VKWRTAAAIVNSLQVVEGASVIATSDDKENKHKKTAFRTLADSVSTVVGSPPAFLGAFLFVLIWMLSGPIFGFSDTWQLVINTATTIVTFLMVFLIQSTQNRDSRALQMKLDELILYTKGADNSLVDLEKLDDDELDALEKRFHHLAVTLGHDVEGPGEHLETERQRRARKHSNSRTTSNNGYSRTEKRSHSSN
jgi:low affinity Fe/Cu permease